MLVSKECISISCFKRSEEHISDLEKVLQEFSYMRAEIILFLNIIIENIEKRCPLVAKKTIPIFTKYWGEIKIDVRE